ncbi:MAG: hypothetical protein VST68_02440 [Nitrospirota bacterium]|nr:hypothetical protein [Nitrospirota bacterium]
MKRPLVRFLGGVGIGCVMTVPYLFGASGASGAEASLSFLNGIPGALSSPGLLQGLLLSLVIFMMAGLGLRSTHNVQPVGARVSTVESHRRRRVRHMRRAR